MIRQMTREDSRKVHELSWMTDAFDKNASYMFRILPIMFPSMCWVAEEDGEIVGYVIGFVTEHDHAFIWQIFVHPEHQGKSISSRLIDQVLEQGFSTLMCTIERGNEASLNSFQRASERNGMRMREEALFTPDDARDGKHFEDLAILERM